MSKVTATRSGKTRATEGEASSRLGALEGAVQDLDEKVAQMADSYPTDREKLAAIVMDIVGDTLDAHAGAIEKLAKNQPQKGADGEGTIPEGIKRELQKLREEVKDLQETVKAQLGAMWRDLSTMKAAINAKDKDPMSDEGDPFEWPPKTRKKQTSRSRSARKNRSSSSRRKDLTVVISEPSGSESEPSDGHSSAEEDERDEFVTDDNCRTALRVSTYRLKDRNPKRDTRLKTVKVLADLKHLFDGDRFSGDDPLTVLHFLEELKVVFDDAGICEGDARHMFRYFLTGEAQRLFKGLTAKERDAYPQIVRWMLRTYVRENLLQEARDEFFARSQKPDETEQEYAEALRELSRRCVGMLTEKEIRTRFVRGLVPAIRTHVSGKIRKSTTWADAISVAADYGNADRETRKADRKRDDRYFAPLPRRKPRTATGALAVQQEQAPTEHAGQLAAIAGAQYAEEDGGADPIGALPWGSNPNSRDTSFGSYRSSGSSSTKFHTPQTLPFPRASPPNDGRKVMLPPGVPYPTKQAGFSSVQPCLGCGKHGHWIADCPTTIPETRDLILEALKARKAKRLAAASGPRVRFGQVQRNLVILEKEDSTSPQQADEEGEVANSEETG